MDRRNRILVGVTLSAFVLPAALASQDVQRSALHNYRVVTVADGLMNPWSIAFLPGGDMLVTERPGRLRIIRNGKLLPNAVTGTPTVFAQGQGGLLDVVPHPQFTQNKLLYLSYSKPVEGGSTTAVARGRFENDQLTDVQDIFVADTKGQGHYGSRLVFDGNGYLFITVGDRQVPPSGNLEAHPAQDLSNHHGKILRIHDDGRVPTDNPFASRAGAKPEIWTYGHRNMQGLVRHPVTGDLWETEHGPQGGDEVNLIKAGSNYGWPVIGYGVNYGSGAAIHTGTHREGMQQPLHIWVPSIGVSGLMIYTGDKFPGWKGNLFAGGMVGKRLVRMTLDGQKVDFEEDLLWNVGRVRDVRQGPDGLIYVAIDGERGAATPILRLEPSGN
jgi:glucose/arabinose dehydrogenase